MIETLFIQNLKLIEQTTIHFGLGLNILTGETGSGKSAVLSAIRLVLGERADLSQIRHEKDLAIVEAKIKGATIRREIHRSGKSRAFINDELVSLNELKTYLQDKIQIIDQGLAFELKNQEMQQNILDEFAGTHPLLQKIDAKKKEKQNKVKELGELETKKQTVHLDHLQEELQIIEKGVWKQGEEESLLQQHHTLLHAQEIQEQVGKALAFLGGDEKPLSSILKKLAKEKHLPEEPQKRLISAAIEIEEAEQILTSYLATIETNPDKLLQVETRIGQIEEIKKRFRLKSGEELAQKKEELTSLLNQVENLDSAISSCKAALLSIEQNIAADQAELCALRLQAAAPFTRAILQELAHLNLPDAALHIDVFDTVSFRFSANPGHPPLPLSDVASGGELSRLLFAIKTLQRKPPSCLIFDEIDSNVGGTTASLLGQKLTRLSSHCQLICVTHFVQVAKHALHHFRVYKEPLGAHTSTHIEEITAPSMRESEYARMLGQEA